MLSETELASFLEACRGMEESVLLATIEGHEQEQAKFHDRAQLAVTLATNCAVRAAIAKLVLAERLKADA